MDGIALMRGDMARDDERHDDIDDYVPVTSLLEEEKKTIRDWRNWFMRSHEEAMRIPLWDDNWSKK